MGVYKKHDARLSSPKSVIIRKTFLHILYRTLQEKKINLNINQFPFTFSYISVETTSSLTIL